MKKPFGGPDQVLAYLSSYTHRIATSNRPIAAFDGENVTFTWHDYNEHYAAKTTTLTATEFLRRFAMHIVPQRFVRIRYFGFLANRVRHHNIALARNLIASKLRAREPPATAREIVAPTTREDGAVGCSGLLAGLDMGMVFTGAPARVELG